MKPKDHYQVVVNTFRWSEDIGSMTVDGSGQILVNPHWWNSLDAVEQKEVIDNSDELKNRMVYGVYK